MDKSQDIENKNDLIKNSEEQINTEDNKEVNKENNELNNEVITDTDVYIDENNIERHKDFEKNFQQSLQAYNNTAKPQVDPALDTKFKRDLNMVMSILGLPFTVVVNMIYGTTILVWELNVVGDSVNIIASTLYAIYIVSYVGLAIYLKKFRFVGFALIGIPIGIFTALFVFVMTCGGLFLGAY